MSKQRTKIRCAVVSRLQNRLSTLGTDGPAIKVWSDLRHRLDPLTDLPAVVVRRVSEASIDSSNQGSGWFLRELEISVDCVTASCEDATADNDALATLVEQALEGLKVGEAEQSYLQLAGVKSSRDQDGEIPVEWSQVTFTAQFAVQRLAGESRHLDLETQYHGLAASAGLWGLSRQEGETDAALAGRLLDLFDSIEDGGDARSIEIEATARPLARVPWLEPENDCARDPAPRFHVRTDC